MKIRITKKAAKKAKRYDDTRHCLICEAIRGVKRFEKQSITAGYEIVNIGQRWFGLSIWDADRIHNAYDYSMEQSKIRTDFEPFTVELKEIESL